MNMIKCALSGSISKTTASVAEKMLCCSAILLFMTGAVSQAQAQDEGASSSAIEEVVVLAQKREQNLQDVPASVAVITGEDMAAIGASSGVDILKLTPAITLYGDQDPRTTNFSIRGISSTFLRSAIEPSASIIIDGETLPRSSALNMDFLDIERVEVLRGPQGTLFGKNVSAGALHIVTKRPSLDGFSGNMNVTVAEDDEYITRGGVNIPLSDTAAVRLNGYWRDMGGWIPNLDSTEPDGGQKEGWGARAQFLYEPSDRLEVLARVEVSGENYGPGAKVLTGVPGDDQLTPEMITALELSGDRRISGERIVADRNNAAYSSNRTTSQIGDRDYGDLDNLAFSLESRYDAGAFDVVLVGSYRDLELYTNEDQTLIAVDSGQYYFAGDTNTEAVQLEGRIESTGGGPVSYTAGLYYNQQEIYRSERTKECIQYGNPSGLPSGTVIDPITRRITDCGGTGLDHMQDQEFQSTLDVKNYAVFTNFEWRVHDSINLFAGARLLYEEQDLTHEILASPSGRPAYGSPAGGIPAFTVEADDTAVIGRVGGQYFFNDDTMLYTSFTTGYKGRAWDNWFGHSGIYMEPDFAQTFKEQRLAGAEKPQQWEVGFKGDFFDGRGRLNATFFRTDIDGYQDNVQLPDPASPRGLAGGIRRLQGVDVRTQGVELEVIVVPVDNLTLSGSFSWVDATYQDVHYSGCTPIARADGACEMVESFTLDGTRELLELTNAKGEQIANAIEFSYLLSADYRLDLPGGYAGSARITYRWMDNQEFAFKHPFQQREDYGVANLSMRLAAPENRWALTFFINNLFDDEYHERTGGAYAVGYAAPRGGRSDTMPRDYKRYMGANLSVNF